MVSTMAWVITKIPELFHHLMLMFLMSVSIKMTLTVVTATENHAHDKIVVISVQFRLDMCPVPPSS